MRGRVIKRGCLDLFIFAWGLEFFLGGLLPEWETREKRGI